MITLTQLSQQLINKILLLKPTVNRVLSSANKLSYFHLGKILRILQCGCWMPKSCTVVFKSWMISIAYDSYEIFGWKLILIWCMENIWIKYLFYSIWVENTWKTVKLHEQSIHFFKWEHFTVFSMHLVILCMKVIKSLNDSNNVLIGLYI